MSGQVLTFPNYSVDRYTALQRDLSAKGLIVQGSVGDIKKFGANVSYAYGQNCLTLIVRSAPHFHSMAGFVQDLSKEVNGIPE